MIANSKFGNGDVDTVQDGGIWATQTRRKRIDYQQVGPSLKTFLKIFL